MDARHARTSAPPAGADVALSSSAAGGNADLWRGIDQAHIMSLELLVAVALWGGIGWWVDARLGTGAWFTVIGALMGNVAGMYLVWLRAQRLDGLDAASRAVATAQAAGSSGGTARVG